MALVAEVTKVTTVADSSSSLNNKYFLINAVNTDTTVNVGSKRVTAITDTPDVDNLFHSAIVDYVKKCLYMDRAGSTGDANRSQVAMNMMMQHERKFNNAVKKYGNRKRSKTGGTRAVVPVDFK